MDLINVKQVSTNFKEELIPIYPLEEVRNFVWIILEYLLDFSKVDILMKENHELTEAQQVFCHDALIKLKQHIPIQHIIGSTEFFGLKFNVSQDVLIPRPETEELVQWIIQDNQLSNAIILDIGTGSGCIPITLKKNIPEAKVSAWDISTDALEVAKGNALANQTEVNFIPQDALEPNIKATTKYDIIVSNPPYVRQLEKDLMHENVLNNEPHLALFVEDNDPLLFYRAISKLALTALKANGFIYFEINEALGKQTCDLLQELGYIEVELRKDLFGKDRMVKARLNY